MVELMNHGVHRENEARENHDEDEQAPAGAEAISPNENSVGKMGAALEMSVVPGFVV